MDRSVYEIITFKKPGALLNQVMENVELITKHFNLEDYVIITGGSNDIDLKKIPSFRGICNKLKLCTHTNILFTSIPYSVSDLSKNKYIFKYNAKLNDFLNKFNKCTEGRVHYVEINNPNTKPMDSKLVASNIKNILNTKCINKTLKFINTSNENISIPSDRSTKPNKFLNLEPVNNLSLSVELNNSNFLCPGQLMTPILIAT